MRTKKYFITEEGKSTWETHLPSKVIMCAIRYMGIVPYSEGHDKLNINDTVQALKDHGVDVQTKTTGYIYG